MKRRNAFTLIELLVVVAIIALLISILLPSLARAREMARRTVCSTNLAGLGKSCHVYANDYNGSFPIAYHQLPTGATRTDPRIKVALNSTTVPLVGYNATNQISTGATPAISVSRSLFLLIIYSDASTKSFTCPSSGEQPDPMRNTVGSTEQAAQAGVNRFDFLGYEYLSYSYQHPYNMTATPSLNSPGFNDGAMPLMADKGPYIDAGGETDVDTPFGSISNVDQLLAKTNDDWRPYNSRNHGGEGQSVMYAVDAHVKFERKPTVGPSNDNIYTYQTGYTLADTLKGAQPTGGSTYGPFTETDAYLLP